MRFGCPGPFHLVHLVESVAEAEQLAVGYPVEQLPILRPDRPGHIRGSIYSACQQSVARECPYVWLETPTKVVEPPRQ